MTDKKYLLIYHKEDNDGVFSGAMLYDYLVVKLHVKKSDIIRLPSDYNSLSEFATSHQDIAKLREEYQSILMTDISFNDSSYMKRLYDTYKDDFIWCDHHAPIIRESLRLKFNDCPGIRDTTKSAILCVYEYLYDPLNVEYLKIFNHNHDKSIWVNPDFPEFFRILSAWDSFSYEREGYDQDFVRDVNKGVTANFNLDFYKILDVVHSIVNVYTAKNSREIDSPINSLQLIHDMEFLGNKLNEYDDVTMKNILKTSGDTSWTIPVYDEDMHRNWYRNACAIFHEGPSSSLFFKSLKGKDIQNGIVLKHQPNSNWVVSLYNVNEDDLFDCGAYLNKKYNGGGHKGAAGCTLTQDQFIDILKTKQL